MEVPKGHCQACGGIRPAQTDPKDVGELTHCHECTLRLFPHLYIPDAPK